MKIYSSLLSFLICSVIVTGQSKFEKLSGPYLGQNPPSKKAELFLDGIISTVSGEEMCAAFTPDGKEFYFNSNKSGNWMIYFTKELDGKWTDPEPLPFSSSFTDRDFTISPDGSIIVFGSDRPYDGSSEPQERLDIYMTKRKPDNNWSIPTRMSKAINSDGGENYPSISSKGNLFFFSNRSDGFGGCDIYMSEFKNNSYRKAVNLGSSINSSEHDWDAFIAPDESYIIFSSLERDDTIGDQDLYISFRKTDRSWTEAVNMGKAVNSYSSEICPSVTPDGKYLFFTSRRRGEADIYWIDAEIIKNLKPKEK